MNLEDIYFLLEYNCWANSRILEAASVLTPEQFSRDYATSHKSVRGTLVHILGAEWIWLMRTKGISPSNLLSVEEFPDVASLKARRAEVEQDHAKFLESLTAQSLENVISYTNTKGEQWAYPLWVIQQHMVNHSTYHRGQVITMLRQLGAEAVNTDLLVFVNQHR